jgi:hypothetical protein
MERERERERGTKGKLGGGVKRATEESSRKNQTLQSTNGNARTPRPYGVVGGVCMARGKGRWWMDGWMDDDG